MTATLAPPPAPPVPPPAARHRSPLRVTQSRVVHSEWTKFRSLRSTIYTLVLAVALMIGLGALLSAVAVNQPAGLDPGATVDLDQPDRHVLRTARRRRPRRADDHR